MPEMMQSSSSNDPSSPENATASAAASSMETDGSGDGKIQELPLPPPTTFLHMKHCKYLVRSKQVMPSAAAAFDTSRMTIAFFAISGLDILGHLKENPGDLDEHARCVHWIRSLYVHDGETGLAGFHGGTFVKVPGRGFLNTRTNVGHIAMTYTALACLGILGDDFRGDLDLPAIARGVRALQQEDGSFNSALEGGENDMRFVFCAAAICHMIDDWGGMDLDLATDYIVRSISYEGSIAQGPSLEGHGGSTYCGVAALKLMGRLDRLSGSQLRKLCRWCVHRLEDGFNGRPNKPTDTCYSFWVGATLKILEPFADVDRFIGKSNAFVLETQDELVGGLAKWVDNSTDPLHTYLGLAGLALSGFPGLREIDPAVNVVKGAFRVVA